MKSACYCINAGYKFSSTDVSFQDDGDYHSPCRKADIACKTRSS